MQFGSNSRNPEQGTPAEVSSPFTNAFASASTSEKRSALFDSDRSPFQGPDREHHVGAPSGDKDSSRERSPAHAFASLQRTFSALQARAQPTLARARYKAEAGLAPRRGFVPSGRGGELFHHAASASADRLVDRDEDDDAAGAGMDPDYTGDSVESPAVDDDEVGLRRRAGTETWDEDEETVRGRGRELGRGRFGRLHERDNLKLPEGDGWAPL